MLKSALAEGPAARVVEALQAGHLLIADGDETHPTVRVAPRGAAQQLGPGAAPTGSGKGHLELRKRLGRDRDLWLRKGRPPERLIPSGQPLAEAEALAAWDRKVAETAGEYIAASRAQARRQKRARRLVLGTLAALVAVLVIGGTAMTVKVFQAFASASEVLAEVVDRMPEAIKPVARIDTLDQLLGSAQKALTSSMPADLAHFPGFMLRRAQVLLGLAEMRMSLGTVGPFREAAAEAEALLRQALSRAPDDPEIAYNLARAQRLMGYTFNRSQWGESETGPGYDAAAERRKGKEFFDASLDLAHSRLAAETDPARIVRWRRLLVRTHEGYGDLLKVAFHDLDGAKAQYDSGGRRAAQGDGPGPRHQPAASELGWAINKIGDIHAENGETELALKFFEAARDAVLEIGPEHLYENTQVLHDLGIIYNNIGNQLAYRGDFRAAAQSFASAEPLLEQLRLRDLDNVQWASVLGWTRLNRGQATLLDARGTEGMAAALSALQAAGRTPSPMSAPAPPTAAGGSAICWPPGPRAPPPRPESTTAAAMRRPPRRATRPRRRWRCRPRTPAGCCTPRLHEWAGRALAKLGRSAEAEAAFKAALDLVTAEGDRDHAPPTLQQAVGRNSRGWCVEPCPSPARGRGARTQGAGVEGRARPRADDLFPRGPSLTRGAPAGAPPSPTHRKRWVPRHENDSKKASDYAALGISIGSMLMLKSEGFELADIGVGKALTVAALGMVGADVLEDGARRQDVVDADEQLVGDGQGGAATARRALSLWYLALKKLPFLRAAPVAALHRAVLRWRLPLRALVPLRLPALWLLPGQTPAQAARCWAEGKADMSAPISAMTVAAVTQSMPGMAVRRPI